MIVAALISLGLAAAGSGLRHKRRAVEATPVLNRAQIAEELDRADRVACRVLGTAEPGSGGELTSPFAAVPCVWYEATLTHSWTTTMLVPVTVSDGKNTSTQMQTQTITHTETLFHETSGSTFAVRDATGAVAVSPDGAKVDGADTSYDGWEAPATPEAAAISIPSSAANLHYTEKVLRPGAQLYVLGEAAYTGDGPLLRGPSSGDYLISTRSADSHLNRLRNGEVALYSLAVLVLLIGLWITVQPALN